MKNNT
jgi:hypothetical protein